MNLLLGTNPPVQKRVSMVSGIGFNISTLNITSEISPLLIALIVALFLILIYISRTSLGFLLRKHIPIMFFLKNKVSIYKNAACILFIDDQDVPIAETLKDEGWKVNKIRDARDDDEKVKNANIIFVDWKGVGRRISSEDEGISLVANIKRKYGSQKYVILYSAQEYRQPADISADDWISKGSDSSLYFQAIQRACFVLFF